MSHPATILAFDCATGPCSAALWRDGRIVASRSEGAQTRQAARLVPMIEEVLAEGGVAYRELDLIATTTGPGSFTGIRIGLATARAMALAANVPLAGFSTLEVLAHAAQAQAKGRPILTALNAGRGEIYAQLFQNGPPHPSLAQAAAGPVQEMLAPLTEQELVVAGNVEQLLLPLLPRAHFLTTTHPDAADLASLTASHPAPIAAEIAPLYIRPPDAKLPQVI